MRSLHTKAGAVIENDKRIPRSVRKSSIEISTPFKNVVNSAKKKPSLDNKKKSEKENYYKQISKLLESKLK
jgi:hypothetical protein